MRVAWAVVGTGVHVEVGVGLFKAYSMIQRPSRSPVNVNIQLVNSSCLHSEQDVLMNTVQTVKEALQLLWSMRPKDENVTHAMEPAEWLMRCPVVSNMTKLDISKGSVELCSACHLLAAGYLISLLLGLKMKTPPKCR
jgi:hypothetical protein